MPTRKQARLAALVIQEHEARRRHRNFSEDELAGGPDDYKRATEVLIRWARIGRGATVADVV